VKQDGAVAKDLAPCRFQSDEESNMTRATKTIGTVGLTVALLAGTGLLSSQAKADTAAAEATFKAKCAGCHGADGKGKEVMKTRDLSSADVQKQSDADLTTIITKGKGKMPAYGSLTPDQVKDMVGYIRSLKK
jgi:cytochrome c6